MEHLTLVAAMTALLEGMVVDRVALVNSYTASKKRDSAADSMAKTVQREDATTRCCQEQMQLASQR
jgi:hypothetical protein